MDELLQCYQSNESCQVYFPLVQVFILCKVALTFECVDKMLIYHVTNFKWILLGTFFLMALLVQCSFSKRNFAFDIENIIFSVLCVIPIFLSVKRLK